MTNDHLAAIANQKYGTRVLLEMVSAGYMTPDEAMEEIKTSVENATLAQKLAYYFTRAIWFIAK